MMTIADKLQTIADNTQRVFNAGYLEGQEAGGYNEGKQAERDAFWDVYLSDGSQKRASYMFSEARFGFSNFYPNREIRPVGRAQNLFYNFGAEVNGVKESAKDLRERLRECGVSLDLSQATNLVNCFAYARFTGLPVLDFRGCGSETISVFEGEYSLSEIDEIKVDADNTFTGWFNNCTALTDVTFSGIIAHDVNLQWSTKLSRASINSLIWICNESQGYSFNVTLSLAAVNKAFETSVGANDGSTSEDWEMAVNYSHQNIILV